jgi:hypothetical protein
MRLPITIITIISNILLISKTAESFLSQQFKSTVPLGVSFLNHVQKKYLEKQHQHHHQAASPSALFGGTGVTANYTWKEEQFEIEIRIPVPPQTKTKHITYKPKSKSMEISIQMEDDEEKRILLYGDRQFRGMVDLDGTFWSLMDVEDNNDNNDSVSSTGRDLVISIEKHIVPPNDPFAVIDYDWGSIYLNDEDEILDKKYAEAEEMDIKEYAASLGVDIDNINMTLVDKNMFSSGLNMTRNTLDELTKSGYAQEVTKQGDGMEFSQEGKVFKSLGDKIGDDELKDAGIGLGGTGGPGAGPSGPGGSAPIPFLDTDSPWRKSMPVEEARGVEGQGEEGLSSSILNEQNKKDQEAPPKYQDPVDKLTVSKLKDILRKEGLKVSGNKEELKTRLKDHVNSVMQQKKGTSGKD